MAISSGHWTKPSNILGSLQSVDLADVKFLIETKNKDIYIAKISNINNNVITFNCLNGPTFNCDFVERVSLIYN